jgi:pyridinium-3,5-biscarboxylic acid mononucleotide synthase
MSEFTLDLDREARLGFDEAIYCAGKTATQIEAILNQAPQHRDRFLLTRLSPDKFNLFSPAIAARIDYEALSQTGILGAPKSLAPVSRVALITAGTSDIPISREVLRTLNYYGIAATEFNDIGVAGLWRLTEKLDAIRGHAVTIVVAGMDAALVSVMGGLTRGVVIAVPTSVGYGAARAGETALHASLASCAPGVVVVNIDNGFGAACAALRILNIER